MQRNQQESAGIYSQQRFKLTHGTFSIFPCALAAGLKPTEQVVLAWIWKYTNNDGMCFPSINRIASNSGMSRSAVIRAISALVSGGLLIKEKRIRPNGSISSNSYTVVIKEGDSVTQTLGGVSHGHHHNYNHIELEDITKSNISNDTDVEEKDAGNKISWVTPYASVWAKLTGGGLPVARSVKFLKAVQDMYGPERTIAGWEAHVKECGKYSSAARFARTPTFWIKEQKEQAVAVTSDDINKFIK